MQGITNICHLHIFKLHDLYGPENGTTMTQNNSQGNVVKS